MILEFFEGLRGDLEVTFEEGTSAAWLYDLLKPHVTKVVVCDPRKNASMKEGNRSDKIDARRLAGNSPEGLTRLAKSVRVVECPNEECSNHLFHWKRTIAVPAFWNRNTN